MAVPNRRCGSGNAGFNSSMSRGQFLRTAGMIGGGAAIAGLGLGGVARAQSYEQKTYYVNMPPVGSDSNPGTYDQPFATIQYAVDYASDGDTIMVMPGYYQGAVLGGTRWPASSLPNGKKSLNIIGSEGTVINRGVTATSPLNEAAFFIAPSGNYTIKAGSYNPNDIIPPPANKADGTTISNFVIDGNNWQGLKPFALGVFAQGAKNLTISHLTVLKAQQGITLSGCSFCAVTHNTLEGLFAPISAFLQERGIFIGSNNNGLAEGNFIGFNKIYAADVLPGTYAKERVGIYLASGVLTFGAACPLPAPGVQWKFVVTSLQAKNNKIVHNQVAISVPSANLPNFSVTPVQYCQPGVPCYTTGLVTACYAYDPVASVSAYSSKMGWFGMVPHIGLLDNSVGFNDFRGSTNALMFTPPSPLNAFRAFGCPQPYPSPPYLSLNFSVFPENNDIAKNFGLNTMIGIPMIEGAEDGIGENRSVTNDNTYEGTTGFVPVLNQQTCEETGNIWVQDPVSGEWYCK